MVFVTRRYRGRRPLGFRRAFRARTYRRNRASIRTPMPRAEIKMVQGTLNSTGTTIAGILTPIASPPRGTTPLDREGNVIKHVDYQIRAQISNPATTTPTYAFRIIVFRWNQGGFTPAPSSIVDTTNTGGYYSPYNQANALNYRILFDRSYRVTNVPVGNTSGFAVKPMTFSWRARNRDTVQYNSAAALDGNYGYYFLIFPEFGTVNVDGISTLRFIDL